MSTAPLAGRRRAAAIFASIAVAAAAIVVVTNSVNGEQAVADTSPALPTGLPATFSATPLPTVQVNGIVWAQVVVGNTVYATGNFTHSRPAGAAPNTQLTPAANIIAYNIATGERIMSFNPTLNGAGRSIAASPDGTRLYVGGDFTEVNGVFHNHLAAFNLADGSLDNSFNPKTGSTVMSIVATPSMVYVGGSMVSAGVTPGADIPRGNLAAFTSAGALTDWAPTAVGGLVRSMLLAPAGDKIIVAGEFNKLNTTTAIGMGAVDITTGATLPWLVNTKIKNQNGSGIDGLSTDGTLVYGAGIGWQGNANFEGRFAANPADGSLVWANDCHGDTYDTLPVNGALYSTGHSHDCTAVGAYPDYFPAGEKWHHVLAESTFATGVNTGPDNYGWDYSGVPAASVLNWFPSLTAAYPTTKNMPAGTVAVSGFSQTGWSLVTNTAGSYMAVGGEFTAAGFKPQQGLTRFAIPAISNTSGPVYDNVKPPTVTPDVAPGAALITWDAAWDRDSENLTYEIFRDGSATALTKQVMTSNFWTINATGSFIDTGLSAGPHTYLLKVTDPDANWVKKTTSTVVATTGVAAPVSTNIALGKPTSMSGLYQAGYESWRAVDGNTAGAVNAGSSVITRSTLRSWWQVDLQSASQIATIDIFGRTDCCTEQSGDYWVFVSNAPLDTRLTNEQQAAQPGVWSTRETAPASPRTTLTLPAGTTGRYVMIRHGGANYLTLAEVQVTGVLPTPPVVDTQPPTVVTGVTATQAGTSVNVAWAAATDLPDPGGVGVSGYYVIRDYTTQWLVPAGTLTFTDTGATPGTHRYQIRAVDKGSRLAAASPAVTLVVTDPNVVVDNQAPAVVTGVTATQAGSNVNVAWAAATDLPDPGGVGVSGYFVIRDYTTQWLVPAGTLTYTDTGATPGTHRYQVRAVDKGSRIAAASAVATVVVGDPAAPPAVVDTLAPAVVTGVTATQAGTNVNVAWAATTDLPDPGGVGVGGYYVVRDYTTQWLVPAGTLTFTDTGATPGVHRYQIRAIDKGNRMAAASTAAIITVA